MNKIIQNMKSGFANIKATIEIMLSVDNSSENYDIYINSKNEDISQTAILLKNFEEEQESKRLSIFSFNIGKEKKTSKINFKSETHNNTKSPQNMISRDHLIDNQIEPDK